MALEHPHMMTVEEYFHLEETDTENRYEYIDGHVYMMAGGTFDHSTISGNIYSLLRGLLRGKPCRVYNSDIKVQISQKRYFHPDITVTCDPRDRGTGDLLQSPRVIFEVLSPSTEISDRTWKLRKLSRSSNDGRIHPCQYQIAKNGDVPQREREMDVRYLSGTSDSYVVEPGRPLPSQRRLSGRRDRRNLPGRRERPRNKLNLLYRMRWRLYWLLSIPIRTHEVQPTFIHECSPQLSEGVCIQF